MRSRFDDLQQQLGPVLSMNAPGRSETHVMVVLPSFSLGETTFLHYAARIPALEHRYLTAIPLLARVGSCELIYLCTLAPENEIIDYYLSLLPPALREDVRARFTIVALADDSRRPISRKLLDRPDVLDRVRRAIGDRPAYIEPWNVTESEVDVAERLGVPINGTSPALWPIGFKSAGRRIFREAGVPIPVGSEDVRSVDDVMAAVEAIRSTRPGAPGAVIKHDNSGSGDGNAVIRFGASDAAAIRAHVEALPGWYLGDLQSGGVVEELIAGREFTSPSAQIDLSPEGGVRVLATHEQILGGTDGQVFMGCRFPALPLYAGELAEHAAAIGRRLAERGVVGRASIDFAAARDDGGPWRTFALEVNLRKGGTTHTYAALRNLVPGSYDADAGLWIADDGTHRAYAATDNLVDPAWVGLPPWRVIDHLADAGLRFDRASGTGVVMHMLSGLAVDGRFGLIAIGRTPREAQSLQDAVVDRMAAIVPAAR